ncbi:M28 family peptidase [Poritiphilus flavus]|uniref:Vacuolar membrane protease n=1 Tax=Poritiphilus flavus TaxID=2697053 RepID=A0A6L9E7L7_9FLAO|nr:M28 family peptidase [Poritiphilus flavus]NAS10717.1 M28 family peptidase [Poritiphilus flavus]
MKKFTPVISLLLVILAICWSFWDLMPSYNPDSDLAGSQFSTDRALKHVESISRVPHGVGFPGHKEVRDYIVGELQKMGLETELQQGYTAGDWANFCRAENILARIKGSSDGKALLVLTHYDSSPHSSFGASDAGSGVATILEGIRAFLEDNKSPKNDIIILISDAEELGLNGADLFVNKHPWAKDVGLALNFEARGSGGPSYMLIETNRGNAKLIEGFVEANPSYPVGNSLAYSIYKMLPNDTDLTVFREDGDIEGLVFAFIDDHFDYHTARDSYERLNRNTLAHQGSYLMPLLYHFSDADLNNLKSLDDYIYFNVPVFNLVIYPFEWIWPMFALAVIFFVILLVYGFRKGELQAMEIGKGFIPLLLVLLINGLVGYYSWAALKWLYPQYSDILHGFTYNGHSYIAAFAFFSIATGFWCYNRYRKVTTANLMVAPIFIWLLICFAVGRFLPGASFFVIPLFAFLACFMVVINQKEPNLYLLTFLCLPALWIFAPFIQQFPVGLGLKMMVAATVFTSLTFFLILPVFGFYKKKSRLALIGFLLFIGFMASAHFNSGFNEENAKPSSLLYVLDADKGTAQWATYERVLSDWTAQYLGSDKKVPEQLAGNTISSKYSTGFTYVSPAPLKEIKAPEIEKTRDTIVEGERILVICVSPERPVNRLEVFTNSVPIKEASINGVPLSSHFLENRKGGKLVTHYVSNNEQTELKLSIPPEQPLEMLLYEASNDLLSNSQFSVPARPKDNIPMPFVLNDAILVTKTLRFE